MRNSALLAALVTIVPSARSYAAQCHAPGDESGKLWVVEVGASKAQLDIVYPSHPPGTDPNAWDFTKQRVFYQRITFDTPVGAACALASKIKDVGSYSDQQRAIFGGEWTDSTHTKYRCAFDCQGSHGGTYGNGNQVVDSADLTACETIITTRQATDTICDTDIDVTKVPHKDTYGTPTTQWIRGKEFTDGLNGQKAKIKRENATLCIGVFPAPPNCEFHSEAAMITRPGMSPEPPIVNIEPYPALWTGNTPDEYPEVDHLIPRVDKYGCGCGTNAPTNALLISHKLNNSMSNDPTNRDRVAIINYFRSTARVANVDPATGVDIDDELDAIEPGSDTTELGGCSAGGSGASGFGLGALALGLALRRRRLGAA